MQGWCQICISENSKYFKVQQVDQNIVSLLDFIIVWANCNKQGTWLTGQLQPTRYTERPAINTGSAENIMGYSGELP